MPRAPRLLPWQLLAPNVLLWLGGPLLHGCGGGAALLHPAQVLEASKVSFGSGVSRAFSLGNASEAIDEAEAVQNPGALTPPERQALLEGALAEAALAPELAPWVAARVGLGHSNEAGITYTGRAVRLDARHAVELSSIALSVGAGGTLVLARPGSENEATESTLNTDRMAGWGLDVPVVIGWQSDGNVIRMWGGVRARYESLDGPVSLNTAIAETAQAETQQLGIGALFGIAAGVQPLWVAMELSGGYDSVSTSAELNTGQKLSGDIGGVELVPTAALIAYF